VDGRRQRDVLDVGVGARLELIGDDSAPRDRLERHGADEARGGRGHDGHYFVAALLKTAGNLDGLISADSAGDAEGYQHFRLRIANCGLAGQSAFGNLTSPISIFSTAFVTTS